MASFNRIIMMGNLTKDPEFKQAGQGVCRLSLASNRQYRNKQTGATVQEVCYIEVDVWGPQAEPCRQYLQKGRPVLVEGRLKLDTWETEGQTRRKHLIIADRVVFLGNGNQQAEGLSEDALMTPASTSQPKASYSQSKKAKSGSEADLFADNAESSSSEPAFKDEAPFEDELPF